VTPRSPSSSSSLQHEKEREALDFPRFLLAQPRQHMPLADTSFFLELSLPRNQVDASSCPPLPATSDLSDCDIESSLQHLSATSISPNLLFFFAWYHTPQQHQVVAVVAVPVVKKQQHQQQQERPSPNK